MYSPVRVRYRIIIYIPAATYDILCYDIIHSSSSNSGNVKRNIVLCYASRCSLQMIDVKRERMNEPSRDEWEGNNKNPRTHRVTTFCRNNVYLLSGICFTVRCRKLFDSYRRTVLYKNGRKKKNASRPCFDRTRRPTRCTTSSAAPQLAIIIIIVYVSVCCCTHILYYGL